MSGWKYLCTTNNEFCITAIIYVPVKLWKRITLIMWSLMWKKRMIMVMMMSLNWRMVIVLIIEKGEEGNEAKKRKYVPRDPTQMHALELNSVDAKRTVSFNANEQPIGDPSVQLARMLGVLVRKLPLTFRDWRLVPIQAKENIWKIVLVSKHWSESVLDTQSLEEMVM